MCRGCKFNIEFMTTPSCLIQTSPYADQVLIAGGIGVTHCLTYFTLAIKCNRNAHLVWMIQDSGEEAS
jgi:predicted ferric reductase